MSAAAPAPRSARGCVGSACAWRSLPPLRDVDTLADARAVAAAGARRPRSPRALAASTRTRAA